MRTLVAAAAVVVFAGCALSTRSSRALAPLRNEGEIHLYLERLPPDAERLALTLQSVAVVAAGGAATPLELALPEISSSTTSRQRLLASGRVPSGVYARLAIQVKRATLAADGKQSDLLVSKEPISIPLNVEVPRGRPVVVQLTFLRSDGGVEFSPAFAAVTPATTVPELAGYCTNTGAAGVTVFNRLKHDVTAVIPTGFEPEGLLIDRHQNRLFVALAGDGQVALLDRMTGDDLGRLRLRPGDRPREIALSPDGRTLLAINRDSNTASFLDPVSLSEVGRVPTGDDPVSLLVDRQGRRAYVFNRRSSAITIVDIAGRALVGTLRTEAEPLQGDLNRAGTRLYVVHGTTAYMSVFSLPDLQLVNRLFVGLGASAVKVDPRTDLFYVASRDDNRIQVFDPMLQLPIDTIDLPGGATKMTIADQENALVVLLPDTRSVAFVDLATRKLLSRIDVGANPYQVVLAGER